MIIADAKYELGWLMLKVSAPQALNWLTAIWDKDKRTERSYSLSKEIRKRSLNANAYAWVLIGQIARTIGCPPNEVYKKAISEIGGLQDTYRIPSGGYDLFKRTFIGEHIGREVGIISDDGEYMDVLVTYGSSDYNSSLMSALIENIVQECKVLEIPTLDDMKIQSLIDEWEVTHGRN